MGKVFLSIMPKVEITGRCKAFWRWREGGMDKNICNVYSRERVTVYVKSSYEAIRKASYPTQKALCFQSLSSYSYHRQPKQVNSQLPSLPSALQIASHRDCFLSS